MGSRLEINLVIALLIIGALPLFFKIDKLEQSNRVVESKKSTELTNFIEYDFNKTLLNFKLTSTHGEEIGNLWYLKKPEIVNKDIKSLSSERSVVRKGDNIELIKNVEMVKRDGKRYNSQRAFYHIKSRLVTTPERFTITKEYDMVNGIDMEYDTVKKITKAKKVKAIFRIKNSKK